MIMYLAAFASAVTLTITPVIVRDDTQSERKVEWAQSKNPVVSVTINAPIEVSGGVDLYVLNAKEQNILRKALLRSVRIVDRGRLA